MNAAIVNTSPAPSAAPNVTDGSNPVSAKPSGPGSARTTRSKNASTMTSRERKIARTFALRSIRSQPSRPIIAIAMKIQAHQSRSMPVLSSMKPPEGRPEEAGDADLHRVVGDQCDEGGRDARDLAETLRDVRVEGAGVGDVMAHRRVPGDETGQGSRRAG